MTNPTTPAVPAGWYPDPAGSGRSRWWDGAVWTDHFQEPYSATASAAALRAPEGTSPYTAWIWAILALMGLLILPSLFVDYDSVLEESLRSTAPVSSSPAEIFTSLLGWIGIAAYVVFAFFDYRALSARGVPRPFHWAWMFFALLTPLVYVIGRSVVVKRRTGTGIAPLWIGIALTVLSVIVFFAIFIPLMGQIVETVMNDPELYR